MNVRQVQRIREQYPAGTRVELLSMDDPMAVPSGTRGTVLTVDDAGGILMDWDNGQSLNLLPWADKFRVLKQEELESVNQGDEMKMN